MSSAKKIALVTILVVSAFTYWGLHFGETPRANSSIQAQATPAPIVSTRFSPSTEPIASPSVISKIQVAKPPSISNLREEAQQNVHVTPPSLLRFGADLGVRMKDAKQNKTEAISLLSELKTCARPAQIDESPVQARALCLVSARELEQTWPDLHDEVEQLIKSSDPQAVGLASKLPGFTSH